MLAASRWVCEQANYFMKKIVASVGLAALGASALQTASAQVAGPVKPWALSATLRGFYDDNPNGVPDKSGVDSFGYELSPSATLAWDTGQTRIGLAYLYSYKYFEHKPAGNTSH